VSEIVRAGYDAIAERYLEWSLESDWAARRLYLGYLLDELAPRSDVLELGCGAGLPVTRALVDAGHHVPEARLVREDMAELDLPPATFDAVCAFYSLTHVPRDGHAELLARILQWLRPGGLFVASFGRSDNPAEIDEHWLGAPMFMSHFDADTSRRMVEQAGFELIRDELVTQIEHGRPGAFLWVLAKRP
jgi:SAM-dependent methyltransferase